MITGAKAFLRNNSGKKCNVNYIMRGDTEHAEPDLEKMFPEQNFVINKIAGISGYNQGRLISGLRHSDVTLLLAGGSGTYTTGIAALSMKHPTLALPQFGGAAEKIWDIFLPHYARGPFKQQDIEAVSAHGNQLSAVATLDALRKIVRSNPFEERIQLNEICLAMATLICIILWVLLFSKSTILGTLGSFFLMSGLESVLGSMSRNMVRCYFNLEEKFSTSRFIAEFVLGIVLAFVLFLILQLGGVIVSGQAITIDLQDESQFPPSPVKAG